MLFEMLRKTSRLAVAMTAVTTVFVQALPLNAAITYSTHALSGDPAPGTNSVYRSFDYPLIDSAGGVAFWGNLADKAGGFWSEGSGALSLVALEGSAAPGTSGVYSYLHNGINLNSSGQTAFFAPLLKDTGGVTYTNNGGIWSGRSGSLSLVVREGGAAPGITGGVFEALNHPMFNAAGQISFLGALEVGTGGATWTDRMGIWSEGAGSLGLIAREGGVAPGTVGAVFGSSEELTGFSRPAINGAGQTAFSGGLYGPGVTSENDRGIWSGTSGSINLIARKGSTAPGTAGGTYSYLGDNFGFNDSGQIAFSASILAGTGDVTSANRSGIWLGDSGSLGLAVRSGDAAPGTTGEVYSGFNSPALNGAGQIAFIGGLTGPGVTSDNDRGIWLGSPGSLSLIAREGFAAPGTDGVFNNTMFNGNPIILNGAGQIAFLGYVRSGTGGVDRGIWATDLNGELKLIVREGDLFDVNDDPLVEDFRTIRSVYMLQTKTGGEDGRATAFNDAGQLAFRLNFSGGTGIFVASTQAPVIGDLDGDGFVGIADIEVLMDNWNQGTPAGASSQGLLASQSIQSGAPLIGDLNGDGFVGIDDANMILSNLYAGTLQTVSVVSIPEPGTMGVLGLLGVVLLKRRRPAC